MTWRRLGIILGLVLAAGVIAVAVIAGSPLVTPLIALVALGVLVAGGNWLNSFMGVQTRKPQQFRERPAEPTSGEDDSQGAADA